jgi:phytoene dehydrogenase-like protein
MVRKGYGIEPTEHILDEFPEHSSFDVAIVGGGPNGLIAAAYLARAGLRTIVVERRHEVGGGLATEETLFPGYYTNPHAVYHMMTDYMPLFRDFDLDAHGLTFVKPNAQTAAVFTDGTSVMLCNQVEDTKDSIAKFSQRDANRFGKVMRTWRRLVDDVIAPGTYLPPMAPMDMIEAFERTDAGREVLRLTEMSPIEIVNELVEDDRVRMLLLYAACMWGLNPHESGLGFLVPLYVDRAANKALCYGGSHKLAGSLSREILRNGGVVLDNAEVTSFIVEDGRVTGIEVFDGRVIEAKAVLSSLPPPLTFGQLLPRAHVPAEMQRVADDWEWDDWSFFTLAVATTDAPRYEADDPWVNDAFMVVTGFDSTEQLLRHWDAVLAGRLDLDCIGGHATVETRYDPTLVRVPGHHVSFLQVHVPGDVEGGWKSRHDEVAECLLERWRRYAPNLTRDNIVLSTAESPLDIETRLPNMVRGSIKHGAYNALQMGVFRPHDACVAGRTPVEGLYLCGASSYPGGLVIGGPGYIAANSVADDLGAQKWWTPPRYVQRYRDTYLS